MHHKTTGREGSVEFGLLWVSPKYLALARQQLREKKISAQSPPPASNN
jgi:beta-carotene 3-hydroxylase